VPLLPDEPDEEPLGCCKLELQPATKIAIAAKTAMIIEPETDALFCWDVLLR